MDLFREVKRREPSRYSESVDQLRWFLCTYFDAQVNCVSGLAGSLSCLGGSGTFKHFKVRWALPGGGKSGGLRLAVAVDCGARKVVIAGAWVRKDDPSNSDVDQAFQQVE